MGLWKLLLLNDGAQAINLVCGLLAHHALHRPELVLLHPDILQRLVFLSFVKCVLELDRFLSLLGTFESPRVLLLARWFQSGSTRGVPWILIDRLTLLRDVIPVDLPVMAKPFKNLVLLLNVLRSAICGRYILLPAFYPFHKLIFNLLLLDHLLDIEMTFIPLLLLFQVAL